MELGEPDASGRRRPEPAAGTEFDFACDMVLRAVGQSRLMASLEAKRGIRLDNGSIAVERATGATSNPRYFAGGDCVNGGREVVDAVADGKRAARAIMARLEAR
jgi:glutamate synthase (NADPH/NADH) small chain